MSLFTRLSRTVGEEVQAGSTMITTAKETVDHDREEFDALIPYGTSTEITKIAIETVDNDRALVHWLFEGA